METKYFEMLQAHFDRKRASINAIEGHPRIKRMALLDLAFEEALFDGMKDFITTRVFICDTIENKTGHPEPEVVLCPVRDFSSIRQNFPVYQASLFSGNELDSVMFLVTIHREKINLPDEQYMIYPFEDVHSDSAFDELRVQMEKDLNGKVDLLPLFIREKNTLEWKPWFNDLEK